MPVAAPAPPGLPLPAARDTEGRIQAVHERLHLEETPWISAVAAPCCCKSCAVCCPELIAPCPCSAAALAPMPDFQNTKNQP